MIGHTSNIIVASIKPVHTEISTEELMNTYFRHPDVPSDMKQTIKALLDLARRRTKESKCDISNMKSCPSCFQKFNSETSIERHQRFKNQCKKAYEARRFLLNLQEKEMPKETNACSESKSTEASFVSNNDTTTLDPTLGALRGRAGSFQHCTDSRYTLGAAGECVLKKTEEGVSLCNNMHGVFGSMVKYIGIQMRRENFNNEFVTCGKIKIQFNLLLALVKGTKFDFSHESTQDFQQPEYSFSSGEPSYLYGDHIDRFISMIHAETLSLYQHDSSIPICITEAFYRQLQTDRSSAMNWFHSIISEFNSFADQELRLEKVLFPIYQANRHFVLVEVDFKQKTFCPINPFFPTQPDINDILVGEKIVDEISKEFGFNRFTLLIKDYELPAQVDGFNCGVFTILYMISLTLGRNRINNFERSIDEYRILLLFWLLKGKIVGF
jgi:hypothetical protein